MYFHVVNLHIKQKWIFIIWSGQPFQVPLPRKKAIFIDTLSKSSNPIFIVDFQFISQQSKSILSEQE